MQLVSIETKEEDEAILDALSNLICFKIKLLAIRILYFQCLIAGGYNFNSSADVFWISSNDLWREGEFFWDSTGEFLGPYTNWCEEEPRNGGTNKEHCGGLWKKNGTSTWGWNDYHCDSLLNYICEAPIENYRKADRFRARTQSSCILKIESA